MEVLQAQLYYKYNEVEDLKLLSLLCFLMLLKGKWFLDGTE